MSDGGVEPEFGGFVDAIEEAVVTFLKQPAKAIAPAMDDLQMLARCLQRKGKLGQAERLLRRTLAVLKKIPLHGTRHSATLADLADISQQRGDHLATKDLLLEAVNRLADQDKYPREYNQTPELEVERARLFGTLADRLVRVHQELGDHEGARVWQAKAETKLKPDTGL